MNTPIDLDSLRVANPCNARWEDMAGDERARFCGSCRKHVFNLSAMTRPEIQDLVVRTEGKFCGRFYRRSDGRMLTADCVTGRRQRRRKMARWAGSVFATLMFWLGFRTSGQAEQTNPPPTMGVPVFVKTNCPEMLQGDVMIAPAVRGLIPVVPRQSNTNEIKGEMIMGKIAMPPKTNSPAPGK